MANPQRERSPGHVFISYVREDSQRVDALQQAIEDAGFRVWRDTRDLWPGQDWRIEIKKAISQQALAFIACFSAASEAKTVSYQREELALAIDELRKRRPGQAWLIPVRFDRCDLPFYNLGGGRDLSDIHCADLFGQAKGYAIVGILESIRGILGLAKAPPAARSERGPAPPKAIVNLTIDGKRWQHQFNMQTKKWLPAGYEYDSSVRPSSAFEKIRRAGDAHLLSLPRDQFTDSVASSVRYNLLSWFNETAESLGNLMSSAANAGSNTYPVKPWREAIESIVDFPNKDLAGYRYEVSQIARLPLVATTYAITLGAIAGDSWELLRAITIDAKVGVADGSASPAGESLIWLAGPENLLSETNLTALDPGVESALHATKSDEDPAYRRTRPARLDIAISNYIWQWMWNEARRTWLIDNQQFADLVHRAEVLLGWLHLHYFFFGQRRAMFDSRMRKEFLRARLGTFADVHGRHAVEDVTLNEAAIWREAWGPLRFGLFGSDYEKFRAIAERYCYLADTYRKWRP